MNRHDNRIYFSWFWWTGHFVRRKNSGICGLMAGKELSWLPSYGPEMRGGTANCSVCISDEPIGSPLVTAPNCLIAMNGPSYTKFVNTVQPNGLILLDNSVVEEEAVRDDVKTISLPATDMATENGLNGSANMILLGRMLAETKLFDLDTVQRQWKSAFRRSVHI